MPSVSCRRLAVSLGGATILDHVDFGAAPGEWVSVVGPNGAGKSTLLRAVAGLVPFDGEIDLAGTPVGRLSARERSRTLALVAQNPIVPAGMTVFDYVLLGRTPYIPLFGVERGDDLAVVAEVLEQLELTDLARRPIDTLSGGERQRALLARALAQAAPVLLLDEPTAALDVGHQQEVLDLVDTLRAARSLTVISTMHDLTLAGQYADRLVMLDRGRVVASGPAEHVLTEANVARHYRARVRVIHDAAGLVVIPHRGLRALDGEPTIPSADHHGTSP